MKYETTHMCFVDVEGTDEFDIASKKLARIMIDVSIDKEGALMELHNATAAPSINPYYFSAVKAAAAEIIKGTDFRTAQERSMSAHKKATRDPQTSEDIFKDFDNVLKDIFKGMI